MRRQTKCSVWLHRINCGAMCWHTQHACQPQTLVVPNKLDGHIFLFTSIVYQALKSKQLSTWKGVFTSVPQDSGVKSNRSWVKSKSQRTMTQPSDSSTNDSVRTSVLRTSKLGSSREPRATQAKLGTLRPWKYNIPYSSKVLISMTWDNIISELD